MALLLVNEITQVSIDFCIIGFAFMNALLQLIVVMTHEEYRLCSADVSGAYGMICSVLTSLMYINRHMGNILRCPIFLI